MNKRTFLKTLGVTTAGVIAVPHIALAKPTDRYRVILIHQQSLAWKNHMTWVIRPLDLNNPPIPTDNNQFPKPCPNKMEVREIDKDLFGQFQVGDYYRYSGDKWSIWHRVDRIGVIKESGWHWINSTAYYKVSGEGYERWALRTNYWPYMCDLKNKEYESR